MRKRIFAFFTAVCLFGFGLTGARAQFFPISTGPGSTYGQGGAFDGTRYLMGQILDTLGQYNLYCQFVSRGGVLDGPPISLDAVGGGLMMAFDGTNYLAVWTDQFPIYASGDTNGIGNIYGRFISDNGELVGDRFTIATDVNIKFGQGRSGLIFNQTDYLLLYAKGGNHQDYLYGQLIDKSGNLIGSPVKVSDGYVREMSMAFDGTNYLLAWCDGSGVDEFIYGQILSPQCTLVGSNFVVDNSTNKSDDPVTVVYDGMRYAVLFHDQAADDSTWNIYCRFVSPSGTVLPYRILVVDSTCNPAGPRIACDGTDFLVTWMSTITYPKVYGRFFCTTMVPIGEPFLAFDMVNGEFPLGGVGDFVKDKYLLGATFVNNNFTSGDVYGLLLDPLVALGTPLLGTWNRYDGPSDLKTYYFNSDSLATIRLANDTVMTAVYAIDTTITPHRLTWYNGSKRANLGVWDISGDTLYVKSTGGDTTAYPTSLAPEVAFNWSATSYVRLKTDITGVKDRGTQVSRDFRLNQNYPNPFNPTTVISYQLTVNCQISLRVYDVLGREVATLVNGRQSAGKHSVTFNAVHLPSGVYFYRLQSGVTSLTGKLMLLK